MDMTVWTSSAEDRSGSAVDFVVNTFRTALVERKLKAGDRLPSEGELAEALKVSRGTVREAMKILSSSGLVDVRRGNGTYVRPNDENVSMDSVLFAFLLAQPSRNEQVECRRYIERTIYELAIRNATEEDIAALEANYQELLDQLAQSEDPDPYQSTQNDLAFHRLLGKATGNGMIARLYAYTMYFYHASLLSSHIKNKGIPAKRVHRMTIDAIRNRDMGMITQIESDNLRTWSSDADIHYFE
ncbi:MAG: FadR family transcriptional regulator [Oscillospiraceae bacterium]|nr:FadR family transcriptional regulator [Oscillospiraceae bacterium]